MSKKNIITLFFFIFSGFVIAQEHSHNFNFETFEDNVPSSWGIIGTDDYIFSKDYKTFRDGKTSLLVESKTDFDSNSFTAVTHLLPNYDGKSITLSGYIKTQGTGSDGAELFIRIDPNINYIGMKGTEVKGDSDWQNYSITLPLDPENTEGILIGGLLSGGGKAWFDDFKVTIDGKAISEAKVFKKSYKAQLDTAYDNESAIVFPELNKQKLLDLTLLGKLWGFLKYHHPEIADGNYNWDYELFRFLPTYLENRSIDERDALLLNWVNQYGEVALCQDCSTTTNEALLKPSLQPLKALISSVALKQKIDYLYANRSQGAHFYVKSIPHVGNPEFTNESSYENMILPDAGYRLLSLYRYWNMIEYYFPYKHLTTESWVEVLPNFLLKFIGATDRLAYETAVLQLIGEVEDSHANLWGGADELNKKWGDKFAPFRIEFIENQWVVTDIYNPELLDNITLKIGDRITDIGNQTIEARTVELIPYFPASNESARWRDMGLNILRTTDDKIKITYQDEKNKSHTVQINMYDKANLKWYDWYKPVGDKPSFYPIDESIGYVTLSTIKSGDAALIIEAFKDTKGIILDIRNYPSAFMIFELGGYFVSAKTAFAKFTTVNLNNPGEFLLGEAMSIDPLSKTYKGKVVVLVDAKTQSFAEYTTMAFRAGENTTVIGSQTSGADGNVSQIMLPGNLKTLISGIGVYYPDGTETQRIGIVPDIEVKRTVTGVREQRDEILERAINFIKE